MFGSYKNIAFRSTDTEPVGHNPECGYLTEHMIEDFVKRKERSEHGRALHGRHWFVTAQFPNQILWLFVH